MTPASLPAERTGRSPKKATVPNEPVRLTRRERQVSDPAVEGRPNREIATSLVISLPTAEGHVEHVLSKLGYTPRARIAAWVTRQRASV
ncbi:hypothetical protein SGFS_021520 [Streptomyces graminofaciens]|uniref:HTH luxR-type domain-containing protein n=1 Tax=Streptomyces graminofaciens TaxID=68212 RepID=A0ABN5VD34_9ACTN|nr:LuxR C-terminal-related transcriptional regulator [Streptomyces graminofaciens]BBC30858.1 hypothetical protein SGFS_021520 [Streptomyces graminofaciens]